MSCEVATIEYSTLLLLRIARDHFAYKNVSSVSFLFSCSLASGFLCHLLSKRRNGYTWLYALYEDLDTLLEIIRRQSGGFSRMMGAKGTGTPYCMCLSERISGSEELAASSLYFLLDFTFFHSPIHLSFTISLA